MSTEAPTSPGTEHADAPVPGPPDGSHGPGAAARAWQLLPWLVAVIAVAVAVVSIVLWRGLAEETATRDTVATAASNFLVTLTSWDATDGLDDTREALREAGTGRFAEEVDQLFGDTQDLAQLQDLGARSEGTIQDLFVQSVEGNQAEVFAVVVQRVDVDGSEQSSRTDRFARLRLERTQAGWQVANVELIADLAGTPTEGAVPQDAPADDTPDAQPSVDATPEGSS